MAVRRRTRRRRWSRSTPCRRCSRPRSSSKAARRRSTRRGPSRRAAAPRSRSQPPWSAGSGPRSVPARAPAARSLEPGLVSRLRGPWRQRKDPRLRQMLRARKRGTPRSGSGPAAPRRALRRPRRGDARWRRCCQRPRAACIARSTRRARRAGTAHAWRPCEARPPGPLTGRRMCQRESGAGFPPLGCSSTPSRRPRAQRPRRAGTGRQRWPTSRALPARRAGPV